MMVTTHAALGALIGRYTKTPGRAALLGVASHLLLDSIPHWGTREKASFLTVARIDGIAMATVATTLTLLTPARYRLQVAAGIFGAILPDLEKPVHHLLDLPLFPRQVTHFLGKIQQGREKPHRLPAETLAAITTTYAAARILTSRP